jgi:hypothetical protein
MYVLYDKDDTKLQGSACQFPSIFSGSAVWNLHPDILVILPSGSTKPLLSVGKSSIRENAQPCLVIYWMLKA